MLTDDQAEARRRALLELAEYARVTNDRAQRVRRAVSAGISKTEIARLLGVHRQTVYDDLERASAGPGDGK